MEASTAAVDAGARELHGSGIISAVKASRIEFIVSLPDITTSSGLLAPLAQGNGVSADPCL